MKRILAYSISEMNLWNISIISFDTFQWEINCLVSQDGIDGKQARRTNTSGPLGEMFDHGLDSWAAFFIPACLWSVFGRLDYSISSVRFYFVLCNVLICFYSSHWEKYLTKVLFLPWGYDISQVNVFLFNPELILLYNFFSRLFSLLYNPPSVTGDYASP